MKKGDETRGRLLSATAKLLQTQGFHGTGLSQVIDEARAPKGSLYFHFPGGKEELTAEALRRSADEWQEAVLAVLAGAPDPIAGVGAVCALLARTLEATAFRDGCPLATVALEASASSDRIHEVCAAAYGGWQRLIEAQLTGVGIDEPRAERLATFVLAAIEGALLLAKAHRSGEPLRRVGAELQAMLAALAPVVRPGRG
jgi:TetR/AcrR family transcriptional regulator, lmrAB and yxaGH operons repressor